jgi:hypothetical protein
MRIFMQKFISSFFSIWLGVGFLCGFHGVVEAAHEHGGGDVSHEESYNDHHEDGSSEENCCEEKPNGVHLISKAQDVVPVLKYVEPVFVFEDIRETDITFGQVYYRVAWETPPDEQKRRIAEKVSTQRLVYDQKS